MSMRNTQGKSQPLFKKRDLILVLLLLAAAGVIALLLYVTGLTRGAADRIEITVQGTSYGTYSLLEDQQIPIETDDGYNLVIIENGAAYMKEADCPDGYCMEQGEIDRNGETIVCLPHRIVVTAYASDGSASDLDAVSK